MLELTKRALTRPFIPKPFEWANPASGKCEYKSTTFSPVSDVQKYCPWATHPWYLLFLEVWNQARRGRRGDALSSSRLAECARVIYCSHSDTFLYRLCGVHLVAVYSLCTPNLYAHFPQRAPTPVESAQKTNATVWSPDENTFRHASPDDCIFFA